MTPPQRQDDDLFMLAFGGHGQAQALFRFF
jgi:hypothetical protein